MDEVHRGRVTNVAKVIGVGIGAGILAGGVTDTLTPKMSESGRWQLSGAVGLSGALAMAHGSALAIWSEHPSRAALLVGAGAVAFAAENAVWAGAQALG